MGKRFERLTPTEAGVGLPFEHTGTRVPRLPTTGGSARAELESIIEDALIGGPCHVLFSGGRDSSGILATAVSVARRIGADLPTAVIVRHGDDEGADEKQWQELVLAHLGIRDARILEFRGEQAWLGPAATASLRDHGLLWPEAVHLHGAIYEHLSGGTVLSGEGGDMVLAARRLSPLVHMIGARRPRAAARAARDMLRRPAMDPERLRLWRTPRAQELLDAASRTWNREPLGWRRGVPYAAYLSPLVMGETNFVAMAAHHALTAVNPFTQPRFVAALAREGRVKGLGDRTAVMRLLFADLLPDAVLSRQTKALFNTTRWGERESTFVRGWDGTGVDTRFVDPEELQRAWLEGRTAGTSIFLHSAWLAAHGLPLVVDGT